jgi:hypothetical protein
MFTTSLRGRDKNVRERERELGLELSPGIVSSSKYTVHYLNTLARSAYTLVGQSTNIPKSHSHRMSCTCAFLVAQCTQWLRGVPRRLNCLSIQNRGRALLAASAH